MRDVFSVSLIICYVYMSFNRNHNSTSERGQFQGHNIGNYPEKTQNISNVKLMSEQRLIY